VSPVKYEIGFYIPEDGILHSHRRDNIKSYISLLLEEKQLIAFWVCPIKTFVYGSVISLFRSHSFQECDVGEFPLG
jgi:hypothetical protein